ncbi:MAG: chorismate mutase [Spirochaetes bacterium]|jgi:isochorismate pyruvate lyase|nr:chorismate mutase [Spirochaetota bacterium]
MIEPENCTNMNDIRVAIDQIDKEIVEKIALRAKYVSAAAKYKNNETEVRDSKRVEKVIESKKALAQELGISPELIARIYEVMINFFINEEMDEWKNS